MDIYEYKKDNLKVIWLGWFGEAPDQMYLKFKVILDNKPRMDFVHDKEVDYILKTAADRCKDQDINAKYYPEIYYDMIK